MHDWDAPVLRVADVKVTMTSATSCDVTMALAVEGAEEIDHRIDAAHVELRAVTGAQTVGDVHAIGRTQSLLLRPDRAPAQRLSEGAYQIGYRAQLAADREFRCPLWLPTIPTDGQTRAVTLQVDLPPGATASDAMPALTWSGSHGETTLGHLPAFVHVPFAPPGAALPWSIGQAMDAATVAILIGASVIWMWWRKR